MGSTRIGLTIIVVTAVGLAFLLAWQVALFIGFLIALWSTAIVLKILTDKVKWTPRRGAWRRGC